MKTPKGEEGAHTISQVYYILYIFLCVRIRKVSSLQGVLRVHCSKASPRTLLVCNPPLIFNTLFRPTIPLRGVYTFILTQVSGKRRDSGPKPLGE